MNLYPSPDLLVILETSVLANKCVSAVLQIVSYYHRIYCTSGGNLMELVCENSGVSLRGGGCAVHETSWEKERSTGNEHYHMPTYVSD